MVIGYFIIQMGILKPKESLKMVQKLGNGSTIMNQAILSRFRAILCLVREMGNGFNMMRMEK